MAKPKALVITGHGINCEEETALAFTLAGVDADIKHIQDVIDSPNILKRYQIFTVPGGFSFGDHTGSGRAYANLIKNHVKNELKKFTERDTLTLGICNGFQVLTHLGLVPGSLLPNERPIYLDRWVDLEVPGDTESPWLKGISRMTVPIAHGEGRYYVKDRLRNLLWEHKRVACTYTDGEIATHFDYDPNPNGSLDDIAGVTAKEGRVLGMMPHPERAIFFTQLPHWTYLRSQEKREGLGVPKYGPGLQLFKNAKKYFS